MSNVFEELSIALQVLKRWETLVALIGFIIIWSLFRYIALVRRKPSGLRFSFPRRSAKQPLPESEAPSDQDEEEKEEDRS